MEERRRREKRLEEKARQDKIHHDDPRNGTVTSGCGTSVDTSFRFASSFVNITVLFKDLNYVDSVVHSFHRNPI